MTFSRCSSRNGSTLPASWGKDNTSDVNSLSRPSYRRGWSRDKLKYEGQDDQGLVVRNTPSTRVAVTAVRVVTPLIGDLLHALYIAFIYGAVVLIRGHSVDQCLTNNDMVGFAYDDPG